MADSVANLPERKTCAVCGQEKPRAEFHVVRARGRVYLQGRCRPCGTAYLREWDKANRVRRKEISRDHMRRGRRDPIKARKILDANLRHTFGISIDDYERMVFEQGGACAICGGTPEIGMAKTGTRRKHSRLCVDHDHTTGKVRGLLCHGCNVGIGLMRDSTENLRRAAAYLDRHK